MRSQIQPQDITTEVTCITYPCGAGCNTQSQKSIAAGWGETKN